MNTQEISLLAFLLERIRNEVLVILPLLPVAVPVESPFLDVVSWESKRGQEVNLRYFLFSFVSSRTKCPHVQ